MKNIFFIYVHIITWSDILICTYYYMVRVCVCSCTVQRQSRANNLLYNNDIICTCRLLLHDIILICTYYYMILF